MDRLTALSAFGLFMTAARKHPGCISTRTSSSAAAMSRLAAAPVTKLACGAARKRVELTAAPSRLGTPRLASCSGHAPNIPAEGGARARTLMLTWQIEASTHALEKRSARLAPSLGSGAGTLQSQGCRPGPPSLRNAQRLTSMPFRGAGGSLGVRAPRRGVSLAAIRGALLLLCLVRGSATG